MTARKFESLLAYIIHLCTIISTNDCGLYRDDGVMIQEYINGQQIDQLRKNITKIFKEIGFKIDTEANLKTADFLGMTFNLINGPYKPYKKTNHIPFHIKKNSNHSPQIIKKLQKAVNTTDNKDVTKRS